ncbi:MAG: hypothetical protein HYS44_00560 [Candidatus Niyogibacteria bacterium]|nr:hypothetical protein [Candidatus Niyogibacteria bacterium]
MIPARHIIIRYLALVAAFAFSVALFAPREALAAAGSITQTIVNSDPCTPSGGFCDPTNAEEGNDTVTYEYRLTGSNDNIDSTFRLQFGTSVTAGTDDAATDLTDSACGTNIVLNGPPTIDSSNAGNCNTTIAWDATNNEVDWADSACVINERIVVTWNITFCSGSGGNTYDIDTACARAGGAANCSTTEYVDQWGVNAGAVPTLEQAAYRWYSNSASTSPGNAGTINTPMTAPAQGTPFRLRLNLHVKDAQLGASGTTTKLQFATKSGSRCDASGGGESYSDLTTATAIRFFDNASLADNLAIGPHPSFDPRHSSTTGGVDTINYQNFNDGGTDTTFTNAQSAIPQDEDGIWDFSLVDFSAEANTSFCIIAVQNGGGLLASYGSSTMPEFKTAQTVKVRLRGIVRLRIVRLK